MIFTDDGKPPSGYINAVFVDGLIRRSEYIVTQAPLTNSAFDFWRMVYDYQVIGATRRISETLTFQELSTRGGMQNEGSNVVPILVAAQCY